MRPMRMQDTRAMMQLARRAVLYKTEKAQHFSLYGIWLHCKNEAPFTPCIALLTGPDTTPTNNLIPTLITIPRDTICLLARKKMR